MIDRAFFEWLYKRTREYLYFTVFCYALLFRAIRSLPQSVRGHIERLALLLRLYAQFAYRYFFPDDTKIKVENATYWTWDGKRLKVWRRFYTFRSFFWHYVYTLFINPFRDLLAAYRLAPRLGGIAYDNSSSTGAGGNISVAHVCTGSNLVLVGLNTNYDDGLVTVSNMQYNAVALTARITNDVGGSQNVLIDVRYLANPATGSNTFQINYSSANANSRVGGCISLTGCSTSSPVDSSVTNNGAAGTNETATLTTTKANSMILEIGGEVSTSLPTVSGSETQRWGINQSSAGNIGGVASTRPTTAAGNYTNTWTKSAGAGRWNIGLIAINEVALLTRSMTDSLMNGASRSVTLARIALFSRSLSDSLMNAASRIATVSKGFIRGMTDSIMNGASRLATLARTFFATRTPSDSLMNGAGRSVTLARTAFFFRSLADSIMRGAGRAIVMTIGWIRGMSDSMMNAAGRLSNHIEAYVNALIQDYKDKFTKRSTSFLAKFLSRGTSHSTKYPKVNTKYDTKYP